MNTNAVVIERKANGVAVVTLNQPGSMNALTQPIADGLLDAAVQLHSDDSVKVVVLTGAGKAFCAGGDLGRFQRGFAPEEGVDYVEGVHQFVKAWVNLKKPVIAAINGAAVGAGMSLMLLADVAYATEQAKIGCAFINMALAPDCGLAYFLPRAVGIQRAKELVFSGRNISAQEAKEIGLISGVFAPEVFLDEVLNIAARMANGPTLGYRYGKMLLNNGYDVDFETLLHMEAVVQGRLFQSHDTIEAVGAFSEKRKPIFKGE